MSQAVQPGTATPVSWRPRIAARAPAVDLDAAERAAGDLLSALGLRVDSEEMRQTPRRMAHALAELLTPSSFEFTKFESPENYDELVLVEDIPVRSMCEHHMLPFMGVAHVGYVPGDRLLGLSKFARLVDFYARRPQTQERMTTQIAEHLQAHLEPRGVGVVIAAQHTCMSLRGARAQGARTVTSTLRGRLREDPAVRAEFLHLTRHGRASA